MEWLFFYLCVHELKIPIRPLYIVLIYVSSLRQSSMQAVKEVEKAKKLKKVKDYRINLQNNIT